MENNNQNKHEQNKKKLKTIGIILLIVGGIFSIVGFADFFSAFGRGIPTKFWCLFIGFPLLGIGGMLTSLGYKREISNYMKNESAPVINEASEDLAPAFRNVANAIKEGLNGEKTENRVQCSCGHYNEKTDKFCSNCGKALQSVCPQCGAKIEATDVFCSQCGNRLN